MHDVQECIEACSECHRVCLQTLTQHCLTIGGAHTAPEHVVMMLDCIQICATAADFLMRGSDMHAVTCEACAEICQACAESCMRVGGMDECVEACRECTRNCEVMA